MRATLGASGGRLVHCVQLPADEVPAELHFFSITNTFAHAGTGIHIKQELGHRLSQRVRVSWRHEATCNPISDGFPQTSNR